MHLENLESKPINCQQSRFLPKYPSYKVVGFHRMKMFCLSVVIGEAQTQRAFHFFWGIIFHLVPKADIIYPLTRLELFSPSSNNSIGLTP